MNDPSKSNSQVESALSGTRALILGGAFAPGERLSEPLLAERLKGVLHRFREAIGTLVQEGLVERLESGRRRVSSYSTQDIRCDRGARYIEGLAARVAAERGTSDKMLAECRDYGEPNGVVRQRYQVCAVCRVERGVPRLDGARRGQQRHRA